MLSIDIADQTPRPLTLELDPDESGFKNSTVVEPENVLRQRIFVGGPVAVKLNKTHTSDSDLQLFMEQEAKSFSYYLVHLTCTFLPPENEPFEQVHVRLELRRGDGTSDKNLVAWSMQPHKVVHALKVTDTAKLGFKLKLDSVGFDGSAANSKVIEREEYFISALCELTSDPIWMFQKTKSASIEGAHRLVMVVRAPKGSQPKGRISLKASVRRKALGLFSYRAAVDSTTNLDFNISSQG